MAEQLEVRATADTGAVPEFKSPTGLPVIPPAAIPYVFGISAIAAAVSEVLPEHTVAAKVARIIVMAAGILGLASPGWRKR